MVEKEKVRWNGRIGSARRSSKCALRRTIECATLKAMATNLEIAPSLLEAAVEAGNHRSKRAAVEAALVEYVNRHRQADVIQLFGQVDYDSDYDYKKARGKSCES